MITEMDKTMGNLEISRKIINLVKTTIKVRESKVTIERKKSKIKLIED